MGTTYYALMLVLCFASDNGRTAECRTERYMPGSSVPTWEGCMKTGRYLIANPAHEPLWREGGTVARDGAAVMSYWCDPVEQ